MINFDYVNHMHIVNSDVFFCSTMKEQEPEPAPGM